MTDPIGPIRTAVAGRYEIQREIGQGAFATVYLARDLRHDRSVAFKVLNADPTSETGELRFLREIRLLAKLQHPNILPLIDSGHVEAMLYYVMPYVTGGLRERIHRERQMPLEAALSIARDSADALAYAHEQGIIHRDIKPENILLSAGHPIIADFGVARAIDIAGVRQLTRTGMGSPGTPAYMSPEQLMGDKEVDRRTDIYSLGCVLYEMLTGKPPFAGKDGFVKRFTEAPPFASGARKNLPEELDSIIAKALARDPQDRYTAAQDFAQALSRMEHLPGPLVRSAHRTFAPSDVRSALTQLSAKLEPSGTARISATPEHRSVGRERERNELRSAFDSAAGGRGLLFCVAGEPGIGKTTLVDDFLSELGAHDRSSLVARGRCSERLAGTEAYLPLLETLDALLLGTAGEQVSRLMKQFAPTWYLQVAAVSIDDSSERQALASVQAGSQERMKREVSMFFEELSRLGPLVLFFDDLHWADVSTVDVLAYLAARFSSMGLLILVTYRPSELLLANHPFSQLKLDLQSRGVCRELMLEFLSARDVERFLALEFPGNEFPTTFAALIHAKTEGSPLFMTDLLRYLRTSGTLANDQGRWILVESVPILAKQLPESIRGMIQRKIAQLSEEDRRLLATASVQGYEFDSAIVATITSSDAGDIEERLETLERVYGFVRRAREHDLPDGTLNVRYRFVHVLYQNTLYDSLTPTRRSNLSLAVAQALVEHYGARSGEMAVDLALLFETARHWKSAVDHLLIAARNASRVFANEEAISLARRGLELIEHLPDTEDRGRQEMYLHMSLGLPLGAKHGIGVPEVGKTYGRAYALWMRLGASAELFGVPAGLWGFYIVVAEMETARALASELLELAERVGDRAMLVTAHNALGITLHHLGDHNDALAHFEKGIAAYSLELSTAFSSMPIDPGVYLLAESSRVLWVLGYPDRSTQRLSEAIELSKRVPHPEARGFTLLLGASINHLLRDATATRDFSEALLAIAREHDIATTLAWGTAIHGWALAHLGELDEGLRELRASLAAQHAAGSMISRTQFLAMLAETCIKGGLLEEGFRAVQEGLEVAHATGDCYWDSELMRCKGELILLAGKGDDEAEAWLNKAIGHARQHNAKSLELRATTSLARLWKSQGKAAHAGDALNRIYGWFTEGFDTRDLLEAKALIHRPG